MDIASYLARQRQQLGRESKQIKDYAVFNFHYVPDQPLIRDECKAIVDELVRFEISGIPNNLAIVGGRGSGKTLTMKYLLRLVPQRARLDMVYANCRHNNTTYKILAHLVGVHPRGPSTAELFKRFSDQQQKRTVVVLDEIDLMSPKDRNREILYLLSRSERPFMVIMLSNSPQVLKELDPATRSSLQPIPLHFRNYDAEQIHEILRDRAQRGVRQWQSGVLSEIAALTTRFTNSDARVAIKTLQYAVMKLEPDLRGCFDRARRDLVIDMINDLSDSTLTILWAAAAAKTDLAKQVYERYCRFCRSRTERPFSYMHFYSNLSYLQSIGLVALIATKIGRSYSNRVMLTFDKAVVEEVCRLRFGV